MNRDIGVHWGLTLGLLALWLFARIKLLDIMIPYSIETILEVRICRSVRG